MMVHLLDGTYELFRHFYGQRRFRQGQDAPFGAVAGVLHTVLEMIEKGATHLGAATDHGIESFRDELWPGYKTRISPSVCGATGWCRSIAAATGSSPRRESARSSGSFPP